MTDRADVYGRCPRCGSDIIVQQVCERGGVNDSGGYIVECANCQKRFALDVGRGIQLSRLGRGGQFFDVYDDEIVGQKDEELKCY